MRYERFPPGRALAPYVEHFWLIEADLGPQWREEILVPNGRPTLLISLGDPGRRMDPHSGTQAANASGFSGIGTRPIVIAQSGSVRLVAAQLSPFGPSALGFPPAIDRHVLPAEWAGADLEARLSAEGVTGKAVALLEAWMETRLHPLPAGRIERLQRAYGLLEGELPADVESWAAATGLGYDQFYRLFRHHVGVSPKVALMIARYHAFVGDLLTEGRGDGLAQLALLQGYYDQAHANRDFLRFTGLSPRRFRRMLNGIARMMHAEVPDLSKKPVA